MPKQVCCRAYCWNIEMGHILNYLIFFKEETEGSPPFPKEKDR